MIHSRRGHLRSFGSNAGGVGVKTSNGVVGALRSFPKYVLVAALFLMIVDLFLPESIQHETLNRVLSPESESHHEKENSTINHLDAQQNSTINHLDAQQNDEESTGTTGPVSEIALDPSFLEHLKTLPSLPKKVHIFFKDKNYWRDHSENPFVQNSILRLMELNPHWNVTVYDDADIDQIIRDAAHDDIISKEECDALLGGLCEKGEQGGAKEMEYVSQADIVDRSDIARLLLLYTVGGMYIDADREVNRKLDDRFHPHTRLCLPTWKDYNFAHDIMCSSPGNELFLSIIRKQHEMGPAAYSQSIFEKVLGKYRKEYIGDKAVLAAARKEIEKSKGLIVTVNDLSCTDGFLVDSNNICQDRKPLYRAYGALCICNKT